MNRFIAWLPDRIDRRVRVVAWLSFLAQTTIIATGGAVRLTGSGLGCPTWPLCTEDSLVTTPEMGIHGVIEFGNRLMTGVVGIVALLVLLSIWRLRRERRDLWRLAVIVVLGIVAQAVVGGIVVRTHLNPIPVALHFLASAAVLAAAVALHVRCTEGTGPARQLARIDVRLQAYAMVALVALMLAAGTVVTGTGPLAGAGAVPRFHLPLEGVTQLHADIGWLLGGIGLCLAVCLRYSGAPAPAVRLGWLLLALIGLQGAVGYTQYFSGLPAGLVWFHVCGSTLIWIVALRLCYALRDRGSVTGGPPSADGEPGVRAEPVAAQR